MLAFTHSYPDYNQGLGDWFDNTPSLRNSREEIATFLANCSPAALGTEDWIVRLSCWVGIMQQMLGEMQGIAGQLSAYSQALRQGSLNPIQVIDPTTGQVAEANEALSQTVDKAVATMSNQIVLFQQSIQGVNNFLYLQRQDQQNILELGLGPGDPLFDQWEALITNTVSTIILPLFDALLYKLKIARQIRDTSTQGIINTAEDFQRAMLAWHDLLNEYQEEHGGITGVFSDIGGFFAKAISGLFGFGAGGILTFALIVGGGWYVINNMGRKAKD